ncbi:MAG TPA: rhomboid family intramembrane serine protease [Chloroflexota bacterium]|jgi:membrane associated rhomboid family serine protease|nr:rhomboid family intramembrane serine protease [Chloroflexota bacterium]
MGSVGGELRVWGREMMSRWRLLLGFVAVMWVVELVDLVLYRGGLDANGIRPRDLTGLDGILLAPFLHGGLSHLVANTIPILVLGWLVIMRSQRDFLWVTVVAGLLGGLGVWLFGRPNTIHIGASGLVFGYLGYLFLRGYWERSVSAVLLALVAGVLYGSALWGMLPTRPNISWEGHLFGFAGGASAAAVHRQRRLDVPPITARRVSY